MVALLRALTGAIVAALSPRASLVAETLALRQQLAVLRCAAQRPRLRPVDRAFWVVLSRVWSRWAETLVVVKPETVIDRRLAGMGLEQFRIAPRAPWQNGFAERFVGTVRRELLDHINVLGERHLLWLVRDYVRFHNDDRPHMALDGDAPAGRAVEAPEAGGVVALSRVGGLHHRYARAA